MTQKYLFLIFSMLITGSTYANTEVVEPPLIRSSYQSENVSYDIVEIAPSKKFLNIRVVGYGAAPQSKELSLTQKKLMAYRASQLDAYRLIAEQLNGLYMLSSTINNDMKVDKDTIQTSVNGTLKGVRLMNTEWTADGVARTIAEISIPQ